MRLKTALTRRILPSSLFEGFSLIAEAGSRIFVDLPDDICPSFLLL